MAHFAEINQDKQVLRVVVIANSDILDEHGIESEIKGINFCKLLYGGQWVQTSYNGKTRGKYASIGDFYNENENLFITPQPYPSWVREGSYWFAPVPHPKNGKFYEWNESQLEWQEIGN